MADPFAFPALVAMAHGILGLLFLMLFSGAAAALRGYASYAFLKRASLAMTVLIWLTALSGLFTYVFYRAPVPESAKSRLLSGPYPWLHTIAFELKEHIGLFPPLLLAAATFIIWSSGESLLADAKLKNAVLGLLVLATLLTFVVFGLGVLVARVEAV